MADEFTYCHKGDHWPRSERVLGTICIDCRTENKKEDTKPLSALVSIGLIFGQPKARKVSHNRNIEFPDLAR